MSGGITILAAPLYGLDDVRLMEVGIPSINNNELLIKVKSVGICGTDLRIIRNGLPSGTFPRILGHEICGVIDVVGENVTGFTKGMRVAIAPNYGCGTCEWCVSGDQHMCKDYKALGIQLDGGFAEYVRVPEEAVRCGNVVEIPNSVSFEEAALSEPLSCVYNSLSKCPVMVGETVLILGAGPIGIMLGQLAKLSGASKVMISNRSVKRLELIREVDPHFLAIEFGNLKDEVLARTDGEGVGMCITANSSPEAQQLALELVRTRGRVNLFGGLPKDKRIVPIDTNLIHYKELTVTATTKANNFHFRKSLNLIASGMIDAKKLVSARFKLADIHKAIERVAGADGIKTVITFE